jgi:hypothetical protein
VLNNIQEELTHRATKLELKSLIIVQEPACLLFLILFLRLGLKKWKIV